MVSRNLGFQFLSSCVTVVSILPSLIGLQQSAALVANFDLECESDVLLAVVVGLVQLAIAFGLATEVDGFAGNEIFVGGFGRTVFAARENGMDDGERFIGCEGETSEEEPKLRPAVSHLFHHCTPAAARQVPVDDGAGGQAHGEKQ